MRKQLAILILSEILTLPTSTVLGSGTSIPPAISGASNAQAFQFETAKARVVAVDVDKGIVILQEEKKKEPRKLTLKVDTKTSLKAGKEKLELRQLVVGSLVKAVFDRAFNAVAIKGESKKSE